MFPCLLISALGIGNLKEIVSTTKIDSLLKLALLQLSLALTPQKKVNIETSSPPPLSSFFFCCCLLGFSADVCNDDAK